MKEEKSTKAKDSPEVKDARLAKIKDLKAECFDILEVQGKLQAQIQQLEKEKEARYKAITKLREEINAEAGKDKEPPRGD